MDWQTFSQTTLCSSEQTAILIVLVLFTITLLVTMVTAKERPIKKLSQNGSSYFGTNGDAKVPIEEILVQHASNVTRPASTVTSWTIRKFVTKSFRLTFILACIIKVLKECPFFFHYVLSALIESRSESKQISFSVYFDPMNL